MSWHSGGMLPSSQGHDKLKLSAVCQDARIKVLVKTSKSTYPSPFPCEHWAAQVEGRLFSYIARIDKIERWQVSLAAAKDEGDPTLSSKSS